MANRRSVIRIVLAVVAAGVLVGGFIGYRKYRDFLLPNVPFSLSEKLVRIPTNSTFGSVVHLLDSLGVVNDTASFRRVAERLKYRKDKMRAGQFEVQPGWNNLKLVRHLRNGKQTPVTLVLNYERLLEDVAAKAATFIEPDSTTLLAAFQDADFLQRSGLSTETLMSVFVPNSYEFFWNATPQEFLERMLRESDAFWTKNGRDSLATAHGLSRAQVYTLASIVERETNQNEEKPRVAGVYLNRLRIGMLLQADPTCVFATRDFDATRVLDYHKTFDSPYNTYLYPGLPPGPISMASIASIDAVLLPEQHDYLYFCARPDNSGFHAFAKTLSQHNVNANLYRQSLNNR
jgi:UPF0755 protein